MAANMARRQPGAVAKPVMASASFPSSLFLPNSLLYPTEKGNADRRFNDQELGELIKDNVALVDYALSYNTWATNTDVLTAKLWPKVKLKEGVQRVEGRRFEYDIVPTTAVPPRGTVRFMSKKASAFSLAIGQKGIGSKFEGRALRSAFGPNLMAMEVQAYAESISLGMSINTANNAVNAAHRAPYSRQGVTYALNKAQEIAREIRLWCQIGLDPSRVNVELGRILNEKPDMDMMLVPDNFEQYMGELILKSPPREEVIVKYAMRGNALVEIETNDRITSITSMANGKIVVNEMPTFRIGRQSMQPLATISRIGEVYPMFGELDAEHKRFSKSSMDIYVYDEPADTYVKIKFTHGMDASHIWSLSDQEGYSAELIREVAELNAALAKNSATVSDYIKRFPQFPISRRHGSNAETDVVGFYLPDLIGNLDIAHLSNEDFMDAVTSASNQVVHGDMCLSDALDDIKKVDILRSLIEDEPYDPEHWEEVARLNINRSVRMTANGAVFEGQSTPQQRAIAHNSKIIQEWVPNRYGALDAPRSSTPAGMWTAGGLLTISNTSGHPLQERAREAYLFLSTLSSKAQDALGSSAVFNLDEMPVNMPKNDLVQLVMTACFGPRVPLFLAAPMSLVNANRVEDETLRRPVGRSTVPTSNVVVSPSVGAADTTGRLGVTNGNDIINRNGIVVLRGRSGLIVPINGSATLLQKDSPLFDKALVTAALLGELENAIKTAIGNEEKATKFIGVVSNQILENADKKRGVNVAATMISRVLSEAQADVDSRQAFVDAIITGTPSKMSAALKGVAPNPNIANALQERVNALYNNAENVTKSVEDERAARLIAAIEAAADERRQTQPDYTLNNKYVLVLVAEPSRAQVVAQLPAGSTELNVNELIGDQDTAAKKRLADALTAVQAGRQPARVEVQATEPGRATELSLLNARYYRTPLVMSYELLVSLARSQVPWILPGDNNDQFDSPVDLSNAENAIIDTSVYALPHYSQSRSIQSRQLRTWSDAGIFSRVAHGLKLYTSSHVRSQAANLGNVRSRGVVEQAHRESYQQTPAPAAGQQLPAAVQSLQAGGMMNRLKLVFGEYNNNFVRRFVGMAYLLMPLSSIDSLKNMIEHDVMPPFAGLAWRLRSDHEVASFLVAKAGIESGANFFNGAHFDWAMDGTRDVYQTRAVITTDAHVIRPENHRLIVAPMPRQYRGGHNGRLVRDASEIGRGSQLREPSVIFTIVSLRAVRDRLYPMSFRNQPPAQIDRVGNDVEAQVDQERQGFEASHFYCDKIYRTLYGENQNLGFDRAVIPQELNYKADPKENHIAMLGMHVRYDYKERHYSRCIDGNGHRHDRRLNSPGARAYLNGETSVVPPLRDIASYLLN